MKFHGVPKLANSSKVLADEFQPAIYKGTLNLKVKTWLG